mmetsp:Transcript_25931/g.57619  ORF Transcript_25931/g.57619 Transcript_25931/m.57619 type:complete len:229 (-) Transcript_25931:874-1560(-)
MSGESGNSNDEGGTGGDNCTNLTGGSGNGAGGGGGILILSLGEPNNGSLSANGETIHNGGGAGSAFASSPSSCCRIHNVGAFRNQTNVGTVELEAQSAIADDAVASLVAEACLALDHLGQVGFGGGASLFFRGCHHIVEIHANVGREAELLTGNEGGSGVSAARICAGVDDTLFTTIRTGHVKGDGNDGGRILDAVLFLSIGWGVTNDSWNGTAHDEIIIGRTVARRA